MKEGRILTHSPYNGYDAVFTVEFDSPLEKLTRVYLVTDEGISRHVDFDNMEKCCAGLLKFDRDAFFFRHGKAIREAKVLLNCKMISNHYKNFLEEKIKKWQKEINDKI